jgi:hypothetical protein
VADKATAMKKVLTLCALVSGMATAAQSQANTDKKSGFELRIGYGIAPVQTITESYHTELIPELAKPDFVSLKKSGSGVFNASILYRTGRVSVGAEVGFGNTTSEFKYSNTSTTKPKSEWLLLMGRVNVVYYKQDVTLPFIELYGGVTGGTANLKASATDPFTGPASFKKNYFAYQVTPIGIRTGRQFGFWAEAGWGYKGLLSAGLSFRL